MPQLKSNSRAVRPIKSAELLALLQAVVDNPERWLSTPSAQFGGRKPQDLVGTARSRRSTICCMPSIKVFFDEGRRLYQAVPSPFDGALVQGVEFEALEEAVADRSYEDISNAVQCRHGNRPIVPDALSRGESSSRDLRGRSALGRSRAPISSPRGSWALMSLKVRFHHVADLTDPDEQRLIATNDKELTGDWVNDPGTAPTQQLGAALHAVPDLEGFVYPSSKAGSRCLAIFMDKLHGKSLIEFHNELTGKTERLV